MVDKIQILNKLKRHKKFTSNAEFARFLEISPQNLSNWYKRNTFDVNLIANLFTDVNKNWLLTGEGEMLKSETPLRSEDVIDAHSCPFTDTLPEVLSISKEIIDMNKKLLDQQADLIATIKSLAEKR